MSRSRCQNSNSVDNKPPPYLEVDTAVVLIGIVRINKTFSCS